MGFGNFLSAITGLNAPRAILKKTVKLSGEGDGPSSLRKLGSDLLQAADVLANQFEHRWGPSPLRHQVGGRMAGAYLLLLVAACLPASLFVWGGRRVARHMTHPQSIVVAPFGVNGADAPGRGSDAGKQ
jgi:hypothetical protein